MKNAGTSVTKRSMTRPNRKPKPKTWSRKGNCPSCGVGTGSRHSADCTFEYDGMPLYSARHPRPPFLKRILGMIKAIFVRPKFSAAAIEPAQALVDQSFEDIQENMRHWGMGNREAIFSNISDEVPPFSLSMLEETFKRGVEMLPKKGEPMYIKVDPKIWEGMDYKVTLPPCFCEECRRRRIMGEF